MKLATVKNITRESWFHTDVRFPGCILHYSTPSETLGVKSGEKDMVRSLAMFVKWSAGVIEEGRRRGECRNTVLFNQLLHRGRHSRRRRILNTRLSVSDWRYLLRKGPWSFSDWGTGQSRLACHENSNVAYFKTTVSCKLSGCFVWVPVRINYGTKTKTFLFCSRCWSWLMEFPPPSMLLDGTRSICKPSRAWTTVTSARQFADTMTRLEELSIMRRTHQCVHWFLTYLWHLPKWSTFIETTILVCNGDYYSCFNDCRSRRIANDY